MKRWKIRRVVEELYSIEAETKEQAMADVGQKGDPYSVTIVKENAVEIIVDGKI